MIAYDCVVGVCISWINLFSSFFFLFFFSHSTVFFTFLLHKVGPTITNPTHSVTPDGRPSPTPLLIAAVHSRQCSRHVLSHCVSLMTYLIKWNRLGNFLRCKNRTKNLWFNFSPFDQVEFPWSKVFYDFLPCNCDMALCVVRVELCEMLIERKKEKMETDDGFRKKRRHTQLERGSNAL